MEQETQNKYPLARRNVYALGVVSFLTDMSSEMVYPLLPDLVKKVGGGPGALGIVEGIAEATASVMKAASGYWSDRVGKRKLPITAGYLLSGLIKPLLGLAMSWWYILIMRFSDRMGKGIRTAPRDALLADSTPADKMGAAFGLHRAMDTMGAVAGPFLGYMLLSWFGWKLSWIFFAAAVPALLSVATLLVGVKEVPPKRKESEEFHLSFHDLNPDFKRLVAVSALFSLANFPVAFLILRCRDLGIGMDEVMLVYLGYNIVYALVSLVSGKISDRVGRRRVIIAAYFLFAIVYGLGSMAAVWWHAVLIFAGYGLFSGIYEAAFRAFCADLEPSERRATSYGVLHAATGLAILPAGIITGVLWKFSFAGLQAAFIVSAAIAFLAAVTFAVVIKQPEKVEQED